MKLSLKRPVRIVILGAGGTGGYVIPHLYRIAYASGRKCRIVIVDGDTVEKKNLIRQNFSMQDVGENKAAVMAERYASVFGIETEYIPQYIETVDDIYEILEFDSTRYTPDSKPVSILIGAVDNNRSRAMCDKVFRLLDDIIYIDAGNGEFSGQVVCGVKSNGRVIRKPVADLYPDILENTDKFPSELSCAERSVSAPQSVAANIFASTAIVTMLYYLLIKGNLETQRVTFSAKKLFMKSSM